jgi:hypothetical protein
MSPAKKQTTKPMTMKVLRRLRLGDNREVRIVRIPTGFGENLIRVGINTLPDGDNMSGAVFPESYLADVADALQEIANG